MSTTFELTPCCSCSLSAPPRASQKDLAAGRWQAEGWRCFLLLGVFFFLINSWRGERREWILETLTSRFVGKGNSYPPDQRNLLCFNFVHLRVEMVSKCRLLAPFLLAASGTGFNKPSFVTKLAGTSSPFLQGWWHRLEASSGLGA